MFVLALGPCLLVSNILCTNSTPQAGVVGSMEYRSRVYNNILLESLRGIRMRLARELYPFWTIHDNKAPMGWA